MPKPKIDEPKDPSKSAEDAANGPGQIGEAVVNFMQKVGEVPDKLQHVPKVAADEVKKVPGKLVGKGKKLLGLKKGGVVKGAMSGALIQSGFDTMLGNGDAKTKPAPGMVSESSLIAPLVPPPPAVPAFDSAGGVGGGGIGESAPFASGKSSVISTLGAGGGGGGLVPAKNKGTWDAMSSYADGGVIGNPHPNKSAGHIARGLQAMRDGGVVHPKKETGDEGPEGEVEKDRMHRQFGERMNPGSQPEEYREKKKAPKMPGMANGGFITMKGARKGSKGVGGKRMPKKGVMA